MYLLSVPAESVFQSLADPLRVRLIRLLADSKEEACLCEFVESLREPEYKLSKHLKVLRQAGLLSTAKEGRWIYHRLVLDTSFQKQLFKVVQAIPDTERAFLKDKERFEKRMRLRENGRCCVGIQEKALAGAGKAK